MKRLLRSDQTLFRDPDVFDFAYMPGHLHHRDAQLQELAFLLQGAGPRNAVLRGPPGTGKTTTVRRAFFELTGEFIPVYVNCRQNHTLLAVYRCIAKDLLGYASPSRHLDDTREAIAARLGEKDARLLVCLDDANYLIAAGTYNLLLYQLLRLYEGWEEIRGAGVFAVTSDLALNLYAEADASVRSVFRPAEVTFLPYARAEIRDILADRARQGLYPGVMPPSVLDRIARIAAEEQDIRVGIDLIRAAVRRAEADGRRRVTPGDLAAAVRVTTAPVLQARVTDLSAGERALLCRIAEHAREGADMASGAVFEAAREYLAVGKSTYHEHLKALAKIGIVDLVPGPGRGQEREVRLRYDPDEVVSVCTYPD